MRKLLHDMRGAHFSPTRITLAYILVFSLWILFSDQWLTLISEDPATLTRLQTLKGWLFVLGTSLLIHFLFKNLKQAYEDRLAVFGGLFEQNNFPMLLMDPANRTVVHCNRAAMAFYGYSREELIGMAMARLDRDGEEMVRERMAGVLAGGQNTFLIDHRLASGEYRTVRVFASSVSIEGRTLINALMVDVTESERKDAEIRRLGRRLSGFLDATPTPACLVDQEGRLALGNAALARAVGRDAADLPGQPLAQLLTGAQAAAITNAVRAALDDGLPREAEGALASGGAEAVLKAAAFPVFDDAGRVESVGVVAMDVTREKQTEAALQVAKEQAEAASRAKSVFLANMSHELRTPLSGVSGMLQLLAASRLDDEQQEYVNAADASCQGLTRLLADILELSRIEGGMERVEDSAFEPRALAADMTALFARPAGEAGLALDVRVDPSMPDVLAGDAGKIRQILLNLLGNAIKFTEHGAVLVEMTPVALRSRPRLLLSVSDTGIGIPQERLGDLFQPFAQIETTFTRRFQGAGLGLAIVGRLAAMLDGEVCVSSEAGQGTTFLVSLPLRLPPEAARAAAAPPEPTLQGIARPLTSPQGRGQLLVAEDDMINQMALSHVLTRAGWTVLCAGNGEEAVNLFHPGEFDAVIMDIQMPKMNGIDATRALRRMEAAQGLHTPVIAVSAYALPGERDEIIRSGIDMHLAKPVDFDELIRLIDTMRAMPQRQAAG